METTFNRYPDYDGHVTIGIDYLSEPLSRDTVGDYLSYLTDDELSKIQKNIHNSRSILDSLHQAVVLERVRRSAPNQVCDGTA